MTTNVETYFTDGCGRCSLGGTPKCKVQTWKQELRLLRRIVLDCGLDEESKWGVACYTWNKRNILIVSAFKEYAALSFFNGALLQDADGILTKPGEHSQAGRLIRFTNVNDILKLEKTLKAYVFEAIEVEKAGLKVPAKKVSDYEVCTEFKQKLKELPKLKAAFEALTPGRQKAYLLHFAAAKQSKTRESRIEKCIPQILIGKGLTDI